MFLHRSKYNFTSGDLQLDVPISYDYVWTETSNLLALFMERELTSVQALGLPANVSNLTQDHKFQCTRYRLS